MLVDLQRADCFTRYMRRDVCRRRRSSGRYGGLEGEKDPLKDFSITSRRDDIGTLAAAQSPMMRATINGPSHEFATAFLFATRPIHLCPKASRKRRYSFVSISSHNDRRQPFPQPLHRQLLFDSFASIWIAALTTLPLKSCSGRWQRAPQDFSPCESRGKTK